jgi:hypothetical protein
MVLDTLPLSEELVEKLLETKLLQLLQLLLLPLEQLMFENQSCL